MIPINPNRYASRTTRVLAGGPDICFAACQLSDLSPRHVGGRPQP
jgi:hypothetical protein